MLIAVGADGRDLSDLGAGGDIALVCLEVLDDSLDGGLDTTAEVHRVAAGGDILDSLGEDGAGEDGGGGCAITGGLVCLGRDVLEESGTKVLELVLQGNGPGNGYTVYYCVSPEFNVPIPTSDEPFVILGEP